MQFPEEMRNQGATPHAILGYIIYIQKIVRTPKGTPHNYRFIGHANSMSSKLSHMDNTLESTAEVDWGSIDRKKTGVLHFVLFGRYASMKMITRIL